jgi:beta-hydroxylase
MIPNASSTLMAGNITGPTEKYVFDETYIQYAKNEIDMSRIVLFCAIERPTYIRWAGALNRPFAAILLHSAASSDEAADHNGFLLRAFKCLYAVSRVGTLINAWYRPTYYAIT